jgi:hypothetical protein
VQAAHAAPLVPHELLDSEANGSHAPLAVQQPFGHEVALQTHCPPLHAWPVAHPVQAAPPVPHDPLDWDANDSHVPLAVQQPLGHEVASQAHCPVVVLHSRPDPHATQAAPPAPHEALDSEALGSHVPAAVQQPEHDEPPQVHAPAEHDCPDAHAAQAAPAMPHVPADCEANGTHVLPLQQPAGHETASQAHCPTVHS